MLRQENRLDQLVTAIILARFDLEKPGEREIARTHASNCTTMEYTEPVLDR